MSLPHFNSGLPSQVIWYAVGLHVILSILVANAASRRGRSALLYFLFSFLISPLLAYCVVAMLGYHFGGRASVPDRLSSERDIQPWQRTQLRQLGVKAPALLRNIGEDQAKV